MKAVAGVYTEKLYLGLASTYAKTLSGCSKVSVGSCIVNDLNIVSLGANRTLPLDCSINGCLRESKYGNNSKEHRNPEDCRAIHSEIDAICNAARAGYSTMGASIFITRYPCEACARAIVSAGITKVYFGRKQPISDETALILEMGRVEVNWINDYIEDDVVEQPSPVSHECACCSNFSGFRGLSNGGICNLFYLHKLSNQSCDKFEPWGIECKASHVTGER